MAARPAERDRARRRDGIQGTAQAGHQWQAKREVLARAIRCGGERAAEHWWLQLRDSEQGITGNADDMAQRSSGTAQPHQYRYSHRSDGVRHVPGLPEVPVSDHVGNQPGRQPLCRSGDLRLVLQRPRRGALLPARLLRLTPESRLCGAGVQRGSAGLALPHLREPDHGDWLTASPTGRCYLAKWSCRRRDPVIVPVSSLIYRPITACGIYTRWWERGGKDRGTQQATWPRRRGRTNRRRDRVWWGN